MSDPTIILLSCICLSAAAVIFLLLCSYAQRAQWKREDEIEQEAYERGFEAGIQYERKHKR